MSIIKFLFGGKSETSVVKASDVNTSVMSDNQKRVIAEIATIELEIDAMLDKARGSRDEAERLRTELRSMEQEYIEHGEKEIYQRQMQLLAGNITLSTARLEKMSAVIGRCKSIRETTVRRSNFVDRARVLQQKIEKVTQTNVDEELKFQSLVSGVEHQTQFLEELLQLAGEISVNPDVERLMAINARSLASLETVQLLKSHIIEGTDLPEELMVPEEPIKEEVFQIEGEISFNSNKNLSSPEKVELLKTRINYVEYFNYDVINVLDIDGKMKSDMQIIERMSAGEILAGYYRSLGHDLNFSYEELFNGNEMVNVLIPDMSSKKPFQIIKTPKQHILKLFEMSKPSVSIIGNDFAEWMLKKLFELDKNDNITGVCEIFYNKRWSTPDRNHKLAFHIRNFPFMVENVNNVDMYWLNVNKNDLLSGTYVSSKQPQTYLSDYGFLNGCLYANWMRMKALCKIQDAFYGWFLLSDYICCSEYKRSLINKTINKK